MLSSYHTTASKTCFPKHCSSPSDSSFPALSSSFLLETKGSNLYLNVKMLQILSLTCFFSKFFVTQTELLTASHTREGPNSCLCFCYFLWLSCSIQHIKFLYSLQDLNSDVSIFLTFWHLPWHPQSGNASLPPLYPHRTRVNIHLSCTNCVKVCAECWIPNHE